MPHLVLAYDADCGPCTRFRHFVEFLDVGNHLDFVSLIDADDSGLLEPVRKADRHTSFHLILPDGGVLTGAAAIPRLMDTLSGGAPLSKVVAATPGATRLIAHVYASFARAHDGSACRYPPAPSGRHAPHRGRTPVGRRFTAHPRSRYVAAGLVGGLLGATLMGLFVRLPDALCVALANAIAGASPAASWLAWAFHLSTGLAIGGSFGYAAGALHLGATKPLARSVVFGVSTGVFVWSAFFLPLMLYFLPALVTNRVLETSFAAHIALGLALGGTLWFAVGGLRRPTTSTQ